MSFAVDSYLGGTQSTCKCHCSFYVQIPGSCAFALEFPSTFPVSQLTKLGAERNCAGVSITQVDFL